ncbi:MAG: ABC transporter ATP-binding protein [Longimicrobiales bacterium]
MDRELKRGLAYVAPYWKRLVVILGLNLIGTGLALYIPYLSKTLVDDGLLGQDQGALARTVGLFVLVGLGSFALNVASGIRYTKVSADILFDMRLAVYRHLQRLSPRFFARTSLGDIMSRLNNDVGEIQRVLSDTALAWLGNVAFLVGTVGMLIWLDWRLFLLTVLLLPPSIWAIVRYRRQLEDKVTVMRERSADIGTFLIETIRGIRLVVTSNAQNREADRFRERNDAFVDALLKMQWLRYLAGGLPGLLLSASTAVVFIYGGSRVIGGAMTLGTFTAFVAYQARLLGPVQSLMGLYAGLATARVSLKRVHELLDEPVEVEEAADPIEIAGAQGRLTFDQVQCHHGRGGAVLQDFNLEVSPGEVVALAGASGSGKSTVADLLIRLLDPDGGSVKLDGRDVRELRLGDLRRLISVVDQDTFIFNATIAENVRYAAPDATDAQVANAMDRACLTAFLKSLPEGADTPVGEHGWALSAGERQRIALARALLVDPAVLILDEATSALDPASEAHVVRGYDEAMRGRTTLLISHRLDLIKTADRVVMLEGGRITQEGKPHELERALGGFRSVFKPAAARRELA